MVPHDKVRAAERRELRETFVRDILPILTPLAIDPAHPFPHISNLSLNVLVVIEDGGRRVMARIKVPTTIDRFMRLPDEDRGPDERPEMRFVRVEEVISANLDELFPGKEVVASYIFQVTRNADFVIEEDEASDLLAGDRGRAGEPLVRPEREARGLRRDARRPAGLAGREPQSRRELRLRGSPPHRTRRPRGAHAPRPLRSALPADHARGCRRRSGAPAPSPRRSATATCCSTTPSTRSPRSWTSSGPRPTTPRCSP